jgi:Peptidase family C25/FlgD Ig-like domain
MKIIFTTLLSLVSLTFTFSQNTFSISRSIEWLEKPLIHDLTNGKSIRELPNFKGAVYGNPASPTLPFFKYRFPVASQGNISVEIVNPQYAPLSIKTDKDHNKLIENIEANGFVTQERDKYFGNIKFVPIRKVNNRLEKLIQFDLKITFQPQPKIVFRGPTGTRESALRDGDIYKVSIDETGMVKMDYDFLKKQLKIANIDQIDPRTIKIYGNGGGMLPEKNAEKRADDLIENAIFISGEEDGKFDAADFILFYGVGADKWIYDASAKEFNRPKNIYDDKSYYFVKISGGNGARLPIQNNVTNTVYTTSTFDDFARYEEDKINLLANQRCNCTQGSGKMWFGDFFSNATSEKSFNDKFNLTNVVTTEPASVKAVFAGASSDNTSFNLNIAGQVFTEFISNIGGAPEEDDIAKLGYINKTFTPSGDNFNVGIKYPATGSGEGYLDFIQVNLRRRLTLSGTQLAFRDIKSLSSLSATYQLANTNANTVVWDITNAQKPKNQQVTQNGNTLSFGVNTEGVIRQFVAFDKNAGFQRPNVIGKITNQNLHSIDDIDLLIVYHKEFENAVKLLADHRRTVSGLKVETAEVSQIYNEFSSGALDPSAIRDFAAILYNRSKRFKYMLLMGDGSFDYKGLANKNATGLQKSDYIPVYESTYSLSGLNSFPSDDYYALLSDTEGADDLLGDLDIAVGRIPCKNSDEATGVVAKILNYDNKKTYGDWRNRALFLADNGDGALHLDGANSIADQVIAQHKNLNVDKLFIDAFPLEVSAGGTRVPSLNEAIFQNQFQGVLTMCYLGHGGPKRLGQEAIITREDMQTWRNFEKLPIFVTATCSFSGYDNPKEVVAGEEAILNPKGSMVALLSTVRAVYASSNETLTRAVFDTIFGRQNFRGQAIGDVIIEAKNSTRTGDNGNKFTLLGDPSMRIGLPRFGIGTTKVNGKPADLKPDTLKALQRAVIEGVILGDDGKILTNFNGTIYPTVYDKALTVNTLGQDGGSPIRSFTIQRNIIFKGAASVVNGVWKFSFVVPKDIDYTFGNGKISYYATNNETDATGSFENFIVGGTDPSVSADNLSPVVQVFMNDEKFVFGGITDPNPTLLVKLSDDNGINVAGTSIGHDLTGVLDDNKNNLKLNNFYEAVKDDPSKGIVRYPLSKLAIGKHSIKVKAWDIANNSAEGYTEFFVATDAKAALSHVLNYPNPFTTNTRFQFEHNLTNQNLKVRVSVYSVSGRLVKTIDEDVMADGYRITDIKWDGKDDFGDDLARGVYLYKVKLTGKDDKGKKTQVESDFEKLVILK